MTCASTGGRTGATWCWRSVMRMGIRCGGGDLARVPELAAELDALQVDVIMTADGEAINAARRKAREIPIVMAGADVTIGMGFIESLARPGGNITGVVNQLGTIN